MVQPVLTVLLVAAVSASALPAAPRVPATPPPTQASATTDQATAADVAAVMNGGADLKKLDALLARLPQPTALRGVVQAMRALVLDSNNDLAGSLRAIDEARRLLPDDPRPKLIAAHIYIFGGAPERAADLWLDVSRTAPDAARSFDEYAIDALIGRLRERGERTRADAIQARLAEIGFISADPGTGSESALTVTRAALRAGQTETAIQTVSSISDPTDLLALFVNQNASALWPRISAWAGADLSGQSRRYLEALRSEWESAGTAVTALPYARRLASLNAYDAIVSLFLPVFDRRDWAEEDKIEFLAPVVARALLETGRASEGRALLAKVGAVTNKMSGNTLNIDGSYLTLAAYEADWPQVLSRADAFLASAKGYGAQINRSALLHVQSWRACALSRLGRAAEAQAAAIDVVGAASTLPELAMSYYVCSGDTASARALLIARLADEDTRPWALTFVQPQQAAGKAPYDRLSHPIEQAVRTAPDVVAAAARVGRILPSPVLDTLPSDFDPFRVRPTSQSRDPSNT